MLAISSFLIHGCKNDQSEPEISSTDQIIPEYSTLPAMNNRVSKTIKLEGFLHPLRKMTLIAEVQGQLMPGIKEVKAGHSFKKGDLIISISNQGNNYNLYASKNKFLASINGILSTIKMDHPEEYPDWKKYVNDYDIEKPLKDLPQIYNNRLRNFIISNNIFEFYYTLKNLEERVLKRHIYALFDGVITDVYVEKGELVIPGMKLAEYISKEKYELHTAISYNDLAYISEGQRVEFFQKGSKKFTGFISRINHQINTSTQTTGVYVTIENKELINGMFLVGFIDVPIQEDAYAVPRKLIKRSNEIYILRNSLVERVIINPIFNQGNSTYVTGLKEGDLIITENINIPITGTKATSKN